MSAALIDRAVAFSAESITPLTRVSGTSWDDGDVIGITMLSSSDQSVVYDNIEYTVSDDDNDDATVSFTPTSEAICYPQDDSAVDFKAYYPYQEEWSYKDNTTVWDLSDQDGTLDAQSAVDLLGSAAYNKADGNAVSFQFTHSLSKVQITVSNYDEFSAFENLEELSATLYTKNTLYNLSTEEIVSSEETKEIKMVKSSNDDESVVFTAIIAPCDMSDEIIFTDGTSYYIAPLAIEAKAGKLYTFTATVGDQGITLVELTGDSVTDWDTQADSALDTDLEIVDGVYQIYTAAGLKMFADWVNGGETSINGKLMNNIDLEGSQSNQWTPIGDNINMYKGTFDGACCEVSGLYINGSSDYQGLFGYTEDATITNLGVSGSVTGSMNVGGVVGYTERSSIVNCHNKATVSGCMHVGGIVGYSNYTGSLIINCYNAGEIEGVYSTYPDSNIGGIVGSTDYTVNITSCYNSAKVSGSSKIGGIAGDISDDTTLTSCYYDSTVCDISGIGDGSGEAEGLSTSQMQTSLVLYYLNNAAYTYNQSSTTTKAYAWKAVSGDYPMFDTVNDASYITADKPTSIGSGSESDPYYILNGDHLRVLSSDVNGGTTYSDNYFTLAYDVDLGGSDNEFTPIGTGTSDNNTAFRGTFDGGGNVISGLYINQSESDYQALFGSVYTATIKNLGVSGSVTGGDYVAGIAAYCMSSTVSDCYNAATIVGENYCGGIVGRMSKPVSTTTPMVYNCYNTGSVKATSTSNANAGGIAGYITSGWIYYCYNTGDIDAYVSTSYSGGITAAAFGSTIYYCYSTGDINHYGTLNNTYSPAGGIAGCLATYSKAGYCIHDSSVYEGNSICLDSGSTSTITDVYGSADLITTMTAGNFAPSLNKAQEDTHWVEDTNSINGGYPILIWQ